MINSLSDSISIDIKDEVIKKPKNLVFTFVLDLHGSTRNLELTAENQTTFDNCRLFSKSGDFCTIRAFDKPNYKMLEDKLHKDSEKPTIDIILESEENQIIPLPRITYDKMLSVTGFMDLNIYKYGIYLISVNEKENGLFKFKPFFPRLLNLLYVDDFKEFARFFGTNINNFGSEYFNKDNDDTGFSIWSGIELSQDKKIIMKIKMSKFIEIIKLIVGDDNYFNLIDYSCSVNVTNIKKRDYNIQPLDIENIAGEKKWGGKRKIIKTNKRKIIKRKRFIVKKGTKKRKYKRM
jgi:hypothetical protein